MLVTAHQQARKTRQPKRPVPPAPPVSPVQQMDIQEEPAIPKETSLPQKETSLPQEETIQENNLTATYWQVLEMNHGILAKQTNFLAKINLLGTCSVYFRKLEKAQGLDYVLHRTKGWNPSQVMEDLRAQEKIRAAQEVAALKGSKQPNPAQGSSKSGPSNPSQGSSKNKGQPKPHKGKGKQKNSLFRSKAYKEDWAKVLQVGEALLNVQEKARMSRTQQE